MTITILTLFPDFFTTALQSSMLKRAQESSHVQYSILNIRNFATDIHRTTDDRPYGGGAGMVLKVDPIWNALNSLGMIDPNTNSRAKDDSNRVILTSAKGTVLKQAHMHSFAKYEHIVIICGHYEGVDERVAQHLVDEEVSIGEYVLTGGEPAAVVIADAVTRLIPGVLGNPSSLSGESHEVDGQLGYPQYTRPDKFFDWDVPEVLKSGNHASIEQWRENNRSKG